MKNNNINFYHHNILICELIKPILCIIESYFSYINQLFDPKQTVLTEKRNNQKGIFFLLLHGCIIKINSNTGFPVTPRLPGRFWKKL